MTQDDALKMDMDALTAGIICTLGSPPSAVGRRLRTEQELAALLGVSRWRLRDVLNSLERTGLLTRRRGSGTFVRKIPSPDQVADNQQRGPMAPIPLFADEPPERSEARPRPHAGSDSQPLQIALWCDLQTDSSTTRAIQAHIIHHLNQRGHRLSIQSIQWESTPHSNVTNAAEFIRQLKDQPSDGYILHEALLSTYQKVAPTLPEAVPAVFVGTPLDTIEHESVISFHAADAARRAVHHLAEEGFSRIGLVRQRPVHRNEQYDPIIRGYREGLSLHGLSYEAVARAQPGTTESVIAAMNATQQLLARDDAPDAIYVSDDHLLAGVVEGLRQAGRRPGQDIGVITVSVRGQPLPGGADWSRLEFDVDYLAYLVADGLLRRINAAGAKLSSAEICAHWLPGETHKLTQA